jgi:hypothetical protein
MITVEILEHSKGKICREILQNLPDWFGVTEAIGFDSIEVFPTLWRPEHPCLFMLKVL